MKDLKKELFRLQVDLDIIQQCYCSIEEEKELDLLTKNKQPLPEGIHTDDVRNHYRYINANLSKEELNEFLQLRQIQYLRTIKNCMIFFVILVIIFFILSYLMLRIQQGF